MSAIWPEYKTCKYTTEAIVTEGTEKGETKRVCANPECPVHHPKRQQQRTPRRCRIQGRAGEAPPRGGDGPGHRIARAQSHRRRGSCPADETRPAVSGRAADGDAGRTAPFRSHPAAWHRQAEGDAAPAKLLAAFLPKAEESKLGRILVETVILLSMHNQSRRREDSPRCRARLQGGRGRHLRDSQAGIRGEGERQRPAKKTRSPNQQAESRRRKQLHNLIPIENIGAEPARPAPHFSCPCAFARPHSMPANAGDHTGPPDAHAAKPSVNVVVSMLPDR